MGFGKVSFFLWIKNPNLNPFHYSLPIVIRIKIQRWTLDAFKIRYRKQVLSFTLLLISFAFSSYLASKSIKFLFPFNYRKCLVQYKRRLWLFRNSAIAFARFVSFFFWIRFYFYSRCFTFRICFGLWWELLAVHDILCRLGSNEGGSRNNQVLTPHFVVAF